MSTSLWELVMSPPVTTPLRSGLLLKNKPLILATTWPLLPLPILSLVTKILLGSFSHIISKDATNENSGLVIQYPTNNDDAAHYDKNLTVTLYCNASASYNDNVTFAISKVNSTIYVTANSRYGKIPF